VLCCSNENLQAGERPDTIAMMADTMGSTDEDSTDELRKMHFEPEHKVYSVSAGKIETASQIVASVIERLPRLPSRTHGSIWFLLNEVVNGHRAARFRWDVLAPRYELVPGRTLAEDHHDIVGEFQQYNTGAELIFGTFDDKGMALLYYIGKYDGISGLVHPILFPGYQAIGIGYYNATMWLNHRGQRLNFSLKRSALHAYESAKMAGATPTVNDRIDVLIATAKESFMLPHDLPPPPGSPVTLKELETMAKKYGPRKTDSL
jgi:hypothetical protein